MRDLKPLRVPVLDVEVTPLSREELLDVVDHAAHRRLSTIIAGHNLHSVYLCHLSSGFREFYRRAEVVVVDGMPLLALLRTLGSRDCRRQLSSAHRIGSTDWLDGICGLPGVSRVTLLGGTRESADAALGHFRAQPGSVSWQAIPADPWREQEAEAVLEQIAAFAPEVLLIGMGMPLQERLATLIAERLDIPVIATVGGALDQLGGTQPLAPRRLGPWGLEWAWRFAHDPRRLAGRYLIEPVRLAALLMRRPR